MRHFFCFALLAAAVASLVQAQSHNSQVEAPAEARTSQCQSFWAGKSRLIRLGGYVRSARFSPDSKYVVTVSDDKTAKVLNLASGQEKVISHSSHVRSAGFSPDSKSVVTASVDGTSKIVNLASGQEKVISHRDSVNSASFSPDSKYVVTASGDGTSKIVNLATGQEKVISHGSFVISASFSPDSKSVVTASVDGASKIVNLASGQETVISHSSYVNSASFSPDSKYVVTASADKTAKIVNLESGQEKVISHGGWVSSASFSADSKYVVTASNDKTAKIVNLESGQETVISHGDWVKSASFSADSKYVVTASNDKTAKIVNLESGQETVISHGDWVKSASFSADSKYVVTASNDKTAKIVNLASSQETVISHGSFVNSASFSPDSKYVVTTPGDNTTKLTELSSVCVNPGALRFDQNLPAQNKDTFKVAKELLCAKDFGDQDQNRWSELIGFKAGQSSVHPSQLEIFALKAQKPGAFEPAKDLPLLLAMLESQDFVKSHPNELALVMQNVLATSDLLYFDLLERYPGLKNLKVSVPAPKDLVCRTHNETKKLLEFSNQYLKERLKPSTERATESDYDFVKPLAPLLADLLKTDQDALIDQISTALANGAADSPEFRGVFLSKLFYFVEPTAQKLLGKKPDEKSDLTLVRDASELRPLVLGTGPVNDDESTKNRFGFYHKALDPIAIPENAQAGLLALRNNGSFSWTHGGNHYQSQSTIEVLPTKTTVDTGPSPPYQNLWADERFHGLVVAGSNLGGSLASSTMNEYLAYYQARGFEFEDKPIETKEFSKYLSQEISDGHVDYLIKEAHSDGDEKNLFRVDEHSKILRGQKKTDNKGIESVDLVFPAGADGPTRLVSNHDFGEMIRSREAYQKGPLVYFNTSCWSKTKAINEIEAAQSSKLVNIPTLTMAHTFSTHPTNAENLMLTGFLNQKSYAEIREAMKQNDDYKNDREDVFLFPDEDRYNNYVLKVLKTALKIETKITRDGKPYNIDQGNQH